MLFQLSLLHSSLLCIICRFHLKLLELDLHHHHFWIEQLIGYIALHFVWHVLSTYTYCHVDLLYRCIWIRSDLLPAYVVAMASNLVVIISIIQFSLPFRLDTYLVTIRLLWVCIYYSDIYCSYFIYIVFTIFLLQLGMFSCMFITNLGCPIRGR